MEGNANESTANSNCSGATLTIRIIRSFKFFNWRPIVLHNISLNETTTEGLMDCIKIFVKNSTIPAPFKNITQDTLKIEYQPHGYKTNDPLINSENDEKLTLKPGLTLASQGIQHETEISYFNNADYLAYVKSK